jgi:hypothetical protein
MTTISQSGTHSGAVSVKIPQISSNGTLPFRVWLISSCAQNRRVAQKEEASKTLAQLDQLISGS